MTKLNLTIPVAIDLKTLSGLFHYFLLKKASEWKPYFQRIKWAHLIILWLELFTHGFYIGTEFVQGAFVLRLQINKFVVFKEKNV